MTVGVTLGSATYPSPLTVTSGGHVHPVYSPGVYVPASVADGTVINYGTIVGGAGLTGNTGQDGVEASFGIKLSNFGTIVAGGSNAAAAVDIGGTGFLGNYGTIEAASGSAGVYKAVLLRDGASFLNEGTIDGIVANTGIGLFTNENIVSGGVSGGGVNDGTITGGGVESYYTFSGQQNIGFDVATGGDGTFTNNAQIGVPGPTSVANGSSYTGGVFADGKLTNNGSIYGGSGSRAGGFGVVISGDSSVNYGLIQGGTGEQLGGVGVLDDGLGRFLNAGVINGGGNGGTGVLVNQYLSGPIEPTKYHSATLETSGIISGGAASGSSGMGDAIDINSFYGTFTLLVDPGASFVGSVIGTGAVLELGAGTPGADGTLYMDGSFSGFDTITFDPGAAWLLDGTTAELAGGQVITGFDKKDEIGIGFSATSETYIAGTGLLLSNDTATVTLDLIGDFSTSEFSLNNLSFVTYIELCYLRGTRIATPAGEVPVEALNIGDTVITRFNGYRRIKWIGRQSFGRRFIRNHREKIPVRIHAGALAPNLPRRDLFVSPGHAMLLGGVLVLARDLINGITVTQDDCPEEVHYHQLEFETHDCVLAEGAWSESFCDYADLRDQFHNVAEFHALYPGHVTPAEHLMCAPRAEAGPELAAALAPVVARAAALARRGMLRGFVDHVDAAGNVAGWAQDAGNPALPLQVEILLRDQVVCRVLACEYREDIAAAGLGQGRCGFSVNIGAVSQAALLELDVRRGVTQLPMTPDCLAALRIAIRKRA